MNIVERPLPAGGDNKNNPELVIVHSMAEYINENGDLYFAADFLERYGLSAHVLIAPNGDIIECRRGDQRAYHAKGYNANSLGVEFLVPGEHNYSTFLDAIKTDCFTFDQYKAGAELLQQWVSVYKLRRGDVKRHCDISPGRKVDPGAGFNWPVFLNAIYSS